MTENERLLQYYLKVQKTGRLPHALKQALIYSALIFVTNGLITWNETSFSEAFLTQKVYISYGVAFLIFALGYYTIGWWYISKTIKKMTDSGQKA